MYISARADFMSKLLAYNLSFSKAALTRSQATRTNRFNFTLERQDRFDQFIPYNPDQAIRTAASSRLPTVSLSLH